MKKATTHSLLITSILFFLSMTLLAGIPPRPSPPRLVNDLAEVLNPEQLKALEYKLRYFNDTTSNQIVVVTVKSLEGDAPASFAYELGEKWQVGQKDFDNGIVVLIKPRYSNTDRGQAFIAIGYGLEGAIPDAIAKRIVENEMIPYFKNNDYYGGISKATDVLMSMASGEISAEGYNQQTKQSPLLNFLPFFIFFIIFLLIRASNARSYSLGKGTSFWTALWIGSALGGSHRGSWNSFSGGSSDFGGGSSGGGFGGGFSGFGGGSFGGGGAGGSW